MKKIRKTLCVWVAVSLICMMGTEAFAAGHWEENEVCFTSLTSRCELNIDMWHYSGGYWKMGVTSNNDFLAATISDADLDGASGIGKYLEENLGVQFNITIPKKYSSSAIKNRQINMRLSNNFYKYCDTESSYAFIANETVSVVAVPLLNFSRYSFDDFVSGLLVSIPLIDTKYGYNLYAVWKGAQEMGSGIGKFKETRPTYAYEPQIHPVMIKDNSGKLLNGYEINYDDNSYIESDLYSIGYGTFKKAGAVGMNFDYAFSITVEICGTESVWVEDYDPWIPPVAPPEPPVTPPEPPETPPEPKEPEILIHRV